LPILGAVLVGGASKRFGSNKADAQLDGVSLLGRQLSILRGVPVDCLAYVGGERRLEVDPLADYVDDAIVGVDTTERSSLLGILAALTYARDRECESVIVLGCDVAVASSGAKQDHWSIMAANVSALASLSAAYVRGERAVHRAVTTVQVARLEVDDDEAVNINDQTTLADIAADMRSAR